MTVYQPYINTILKYNNGHIHIQEVSKMAVKQFIGKRYVPVFADPTEWDSSRKYEALTIVTHNGDSYTSAQDVPAGIAITNERYWKHTGSYNAQVEQYRKEVASLRARVDALEKKTQS